VREGEKGVKQGQTGVRYFSKCFLHIYSLPGIDIFVDVSRTVYAYIASKQMPRTIPWDGGEGGGGDRGVGGGVTEREWTDL